VAVKPLNPSSLGEKAQLNTKRRAKMTKPFARRVFIIMINNLISPDFFKNRLKSGSDSQ
jgi:hypothetical protein